MGSRLAQIESLLTRVSLALLAAGLTACGINGSSTSDAVVTGCTLPSDQQGTLSGRWALQPVPIAFHAGDFSATEMAAMTAAADSWNAFYGTSLNFSIVEYGGDPANPRQSSLANPGSAVSSENIITSTNFTAPVVIYKDTTWPYTSNSQVIALTSFETSGTQGLGQIPPVNMHMAIVEVNYQNFFVNGKVPDLQTILLHELGHVAGLNHSCENSAIRAGTPVCDPNNQPDYYNAVMAPVFGFDQYGNGQQKRSLTTNDMERANCLYIDIKH